VILEDYSNEEKENIFKTVHTQKTLRNAKRDEICKKKIKSSVNS
jgi:hypothetical protein